MSSPDAEHPVSSAASALERELYWAGPPVPDGTPAAGVTADSLISQRWYELAEHAPVGVHAAVPRGRGRPPGRQPAEALDQARALPRHPAARASVRPRRRRHRTPGFRNRPAAGRRRPRARSPPRGARVADAGGARAPRAAVACARSRRPAHRAVGRGRRGPCGRTRDGSRRAAVGMGRRRGRHDRRRRRARRRAPRRGALARRVLADAAPRRAVDHAAAGVEQPVVLSRSEPGRASSTRRRSRPWDPDSELHGRLRLEATGRWWTVRQVLRDEDDLRFVLEKRA